MVYLCDSCRMLTLNFDPFPVLTTERLILRPISEKDASEIFFFRSDPDMMRYIDRQPATSIEQAVDWVKMIRSGIEKNENILWGLQLKNDNKLIGNITFWRIEKEHYRAEIGYMLHTAHQGKGLMKEAMTAALDYGFNTIKLHSVEANVNPANDASIKLLERTGFVREAYFRENYFFNGKFIDSAIYSLLAPPSNR